MQKVKCPRCGKEDAIIHVQYGILPGEKCQKEDENDHLSKAPEFATISKHNRVTEQRDRFAKDILQPFEGKTNKPNLDFAKAYPEKAKDYYSPEQLSKL
jgi:hypothetical protein